MKDKLWTGCTEELILKRVKVTDAKYRGSHILLLVVYRDFEVLDPSKAHALLRIIPWYKAQQIIWFPDH